MKKDLRIIANAFLFPLYIGLGLTFISFSTILLFNIEDTSRELFEGLWTLQPYGVLELGILILILSPFFAMLGAVVYFVKQNDRKYALLTTVVILILTIAIIIGAF